MKNISLILVCCIFFVTNMVAQQIAPPDFRCMKGDTLFWDIPANTCGPFVGYEVWASQSVTGPFMLVATIADPSEDSYFFVNPSGAKWYFYLKSNHNCPGWTAATSDTLDNRPPEVSPIQSVNVANGQVQVTWYPSPSPEVTAYVIYRETDIGVVPVDTVFNSNTYIDPVAQPGLGSESYYVNALDPCGNTSIFDAKHSTIYLEGTISECEQSATLNWNPYQGWVNGIGEQSLLVSVNGGAFQVAAAIDAGAGTYVFGGLNDGDVYCFMVEAEEAVSGIISRSNEFCIVADIVQPMQDFFLSGLTVADNNGTVTLGWGWDTTAEINEVQILSSAQNADYQSIETFQPQFPLLPQNSYGDVSGAALLAPVFYKLQTKDDCGDLAQSTYGATVHLTVTSVPGNINQLAWTPFALENATVNTYAIHKVVDGVASVLETLPATTFLLDDNFDPTNLAEAEACYFVTANATLTPPDGSQMTVTSKSNQACAEQTARILTPNAFAPDGINQEFRPLIVLGDLAQYEMRVFDRYGKEVFFSDSPEVGWNGKIGVRKLPQGVYAFAIRVVQSNGKQSEKKGYVLLLR